jgi:hypothetical protein
VIPGTFSAVRRASSLDFMYRATRLILGGSEGVGSRCHILCSELVCGGTEGVGSSFHVLRTRNRFRRYRGRPIPFSCFPLSDMFLVVRRASDPIFMFCAPRLVFGGTEGAGSCFHDLRNRRRFPRYRGRRVPLSCFARSNSFLAVPRASGPVIMFCASELIFGGTEDIGSRFHVLRSRTRFR